jgi:hypothetical protein
MQSINQFISISFLILFFNIKSISQSVNIGFGPIFTKTNSQSLIVNTKEDFSNTSYIFNFTYEHFLPHKNFSIASTYFEYKGCTYMLFELGGYKDPSGIDVIGKGFCGGTKISRLDFTMNYNLIPKKRKFYLKPSLGIGLQKSKVFDDVEPYNTLIPINGPDYFEVEPYTATKYNTLQLVPLFGIKMGWLFWERIDIGFAIQGFLGFKAYQTMQLKYSYKGVLQPTAEYSANGTGYFWTLSLGYRFAKLIKD